MDVRYLIFAICSSALCFLYIYLSILVILQRRKFRVAYLTNDDKGFIARFRAHANFAEYVPLSLILMMVAIELDIHPVALGIIAVLLVFARCVHAYGLIKREAHGQLGYRVLGMVTTFTLLLVLALFNSCKAILMWWNISL